MSDTTTDDRPALDADTREHLEKRLLEERRKRQDDLDTALESAAETPGNAAGELSRVPSHPADAATHADEIDRDQRAAERSTESIRQIDDALERLRDRPEKYGVCQVCGEVIDEARLDLLPWTRYCADHADGQEG